MERPRNLPPPTEQPKRRKIPTPASAFQIAGENWELADASALKALESGTADAIQQRRALDWILRNACGMPEWAYLPGDAAATHVQLGRHFVGHQIMKLLRMNLAEAKRRETNADAHEPKSV